MAIDRLAPILKDAIEARRGLLDAAHETAVRLFNGFTEGCPDLVVDLYGDTAVFHNYADPPEAGKHNIDIAWQAACEQLPWIRAGLVKERASRADARRRGRPLNDKLLTSRVRENGLWYSIDLMLHQDCSLYLDTRNLRRWAKDFLGGTTVLNAFAYTGSLGVAALGGGASRVLHVDRTRRFLDLARTSYSFNRFPIHRRDFVCADFFGESAGLRRRRQTFDCAFLDPPFFSLAPTGTVDQEKQSARLINKIRPLVNKGGSLIAVNNAVYVSGAAYMHALESLTSDGHVQILDLIPIPADFVGFLTTQTATPITDPTPFNHSTKIAVLRVL